MHATRIFGHIAADAAHHLTGGIWRVREAITNNRTAHPTVDHTGLHRDRLIGEINVKNATHAAGHNQQRVLLHQRTTGKPGTTPSSHKGNALTMATGQDLGHLLSRFWQHRKLRHVPVHGETVTVVRQQFLAPCDD